MTFLEAIQYLNSFINHEDNLKNIQKAPLCLERVRFLLELLGRPDRKVKFIHVAGTKGKGSTCAFAASILKCAGLKVGLYTSPHIKNFRERIRILDNENARLSDDIFTGCISEDNICSILELMKPKIDEVQAKSEYGSLTYFEILTVLAIYYFFKNGVDCAVLETGLGGRLDATNVVDSLVCAITSIGLEHTRQLGETIDAIAGEKAAIIKTETQQVVVAPQDEKALVVIQKRCYEKGVKAYYLGKDIFFELIEQNEKRQVFKVDGLKETYDLQTSLLGFHQIINAAVAVGLVEAVACFGINIEKEDIENGIALAFWPGRFEILGKKPRIVLDCAHTVQSAQNISKTISDVFKGRKVRLILGLSDDKDKRVICDNFSLIADEIILTKSRHARACDINVHEIQDSFKGKNIFETRTVSQAIEIAIQRSKPDDIILVTGSIFLVAEAREILKSRQSTVYSPQQALFNVDRGPSTVDLFKKEHKRCLR